MINPFTDVNWQPGKKELRGFALGLMISLPLLAAIIAGVVRWKMGLWPGWLAWVSASGFALGLGAWAVPPLARVVYTVFHGLGCTVGLIVSNTLLIAVFYLVITPIGLGLRLCGKDPLNRRWDSKAKTYWKDADKSVDPRSYLRQF